MVYAYTGLTGQSLLQLGACLGVRMLMGLRTANSVNAIGTLEEITSGGVCWITLRQSPLGLFEPRRGELESGG